jgi:hypothetical protein
MDAGHKLDKPQNLPQSTHITLFSPTFTTPATYLSPLQHVASILIFILLCTLTNPSRSPSIYRNLPSKPIIHLPYLSTKLQLLINLLIPLPGRNIPGDPSEPGQLQLIVNGL